MFIAQRLLSADLSELSATLSAWRQRWPDAGVLALQHACPPGPWLTFYGAGRRMYLA